MEYPVRGQKVGRAKVELTKSLRANQTDAEAMLWQRLRRSQLCGLHFRRQQIIAGLIVDFYCDAAHLIVEVDGDVHDQQIDADAEREQILVESGFHVIRFRNQEVETSVESVLAKIAAATGRTW